MRTRLGYVFFYLPSLDGVCGMNQTVIRVRVNGGCNEASIAALVVTIAEFELRGRDEMSDIQTARRNLVDVHDECGFGFLGVDDGRENCAVLAAVLDHTDVGVVGSVNWKIDNLRGSGATHGLVHVRATHVG